MIKSKIDIQIRRVDSVETNEATYYFISVESIEKATNFKQEVYTLPYSVTLYQIKMFVIFVVCMCTP